ncbi:unnamed protein product [Adineta steineri]|uniref:Alkylmercury lyase n=1 Tax=Adineta steineri TaxID=433720 RepID=A0A813UT08_9BILA|nr:unnamed protein product [Adineta steineri]CAF4111007.1 unnamed protein product [Adineta steineri]
MNLNLSSLHHILLKGIVENGYAPSIETLSINFQRTKQDIMQCLKDLEEYHGVVLHPKTSEVWIIHPFSLSPTNFWVETSKCQWWGNCAWCSLGIAAILNEDVTITTTLAGESKQIKISIKNGQIITDQCLFIHFPIPMKNAWDNVVFTCSVMQIFLSEIDIDNWCKRHNFPKGDIQPIENIWNFARIWYGNHLQQDWKKWTNEQAKSIFEKFNLTHNIWDIPPTDSRF